jgi:Sulfotransferase family
MHAELELVMVVGVGRSGTSLLQSMLASHSKLAFPPETSFLRRYVATGRLRRLARRRGAAAVVAALAADERFLRVGITPQVLVERATGPDGITDESLYVALLTACAAQQGKPRVGDKDPKVLECLDILAAAFPRAWVVHVIRDPRDVLASRKRAAWSRRRPWPLHVLANRAQLRLGRILGPRHFGDRYVEVIYEELIAHPERELAALCRRLDIGFEPAMLEFGGTARSLVAQSELAWKRETLGPLLGANRDKWRDELTPLEVAVTERACREAMAAGSYTMSDAVDRLGPMERFALHLAAGGIATAGDAYARLRLRGGIE